MTILDVLATGLFPLSFLMLLAPAYLQGRRDRAADPIADRIAWHADAARRAE